MDQIVYHSEVLETQIDASELILKRCSPTGFDGKVAEEVACGCGRSDGDSVDDVDFTGANGVADNARESSKAFLEMVTDGCPIGKPQCIPGPSDRRRDEEKHENKLV